MRKVKCYGRKKTRLIETSAVKEFFENFSSQTKNCISSGSYDNKEKEGVSSFATFWQKELFPTSPSNSCVESGKNDKRVAHKVKTSVKKLKKYKGKRKLKKHVIQPIKELEADIDLKEPKWDSINEHSLVVEYNFRKIGDFVHEFIDKSVPHNISFSDKRNSRFLQESSHIQPSTHFPGSFTIPQHAKNNSVDENDLNPKMFTSKMNELFSPIIAVQPNLDSIESHSGEFKNLEIKKETNFYGQVINPVTSTPMFHHMKSNLTHINVSNLSPISVNKKKPSSKGELTFEASCSQILLPKMHPSRSLKLNNKTSLYKSNESTQQEFHVSRKAKACTNRERSIFLRSHSSLKEVLTEATGNVEKSSLLKLLELCNQMKVVPFIDIYSWSEKSVRKVGEGSYGEVFMVTQYKKSVVIKVIPISEEFGNTLQSIESVYSEIKVSQCLSELRNNENFRTTNFLLLENVYIVQGNYPKELLNAWDKYSDSRTTYNHRPDTFGNKQIFAILELEYGGKDLASFVLRNGAEAESVFKQIAVSLAIAEETHLFEHRDLHLGNILVQRIKSKNVTYKLRGKSFSFPSEGVFVTIIDFTLSRILDGGCIYYNDLAEDESLFNQSGDFQFEVYKATKLQLKNQWHECLLYSNVLWLNFLCLKLKEHGYSRPSSIKHMKSMKNIEMFSEKLQLCKSALDCLEVCKIIAPLPEKFLTQDTKLNSRIFIDRKSCQKTSFK